MFKKTLSLLTNGNRLPFAVVLALACIYANVAHGQERLPNCHVLSIGVDNYTNIGKLKGDVNDARNTTAAFKAQEGKLFGKVSDYTLVDEEASRANIESRAKAIYKVTRPGDFVVIFMSGHGGVHKESNHWYFCPCDLDPKNLAGTALTDRQILDAADQYIRQGANVVIIIDACFSGQLRNAAQPYFNKYRNANAGGLVVMASSAADQISNALGEYSAFAKAFADSMAGNADLNQDGRITLEEIRQYTGKRTNELLKQRNNKNTQDSSVAWSASIPGTMTLAMAPGAENQQANANAPAPAPAKKTSKRWIGRENLPGYGALSFTFSSDGTVVMADAKATSTGTWECVGNEISIRFENGRVLYTGTVNDTQIMGSASNGNSTWAFSVRPEANRPTPSTNEQ